jgi:TonB family protein
MTPKKLLIITILISLAGHIGILALTCLSKTNQAPYKEDTFVVSLAENPSIPEEAIDKNPAGLPDFTPTANAAVMEDTVNLDSTDTVYRPYLMKIKTKIEKEWLYPDKSFTGIEEGTAVVEFAIAQNGILTNASTVISSGHKSLDMESIRVIRSAAPFAPFPENFKLSKLNIVAKFRYKLLRP